jgi:hypothetical protein
MAIFAITGFHQLIQEIYKSRTRQTTEEASQITKPEPNLTLQQLQSLIFVKEKVPSASKATWQQMVKDGARQLLNEFWPSLTQQQQSKVLEIPQAEAIAREPITIKIGKAAINWDRHTLSFAGLRERDVFQVDGKTVSGLKLTALSVENALRCIEQLKEKEEFTNTDWLNIVKNISPGEKDPDALLNVTNIILERIRPGIIKLDNGNYKLIKTFKKANLETTQFAIGRKPLYINYQLDSDTNLYDVKIRPDIDSTSRNSLRVGKGDLHFIFHLFTFLEGKGLGSHEIPLEEGKQIGIHNLPNNLNSALANAGINLKILVKRSKDFHSPLIIELSETQHTPKEKTDPRSHNKESAQNQIQLLEVKLSYCHFFPVPHFNEQIPQLKNAIANNSLAESLFQIFAEIPHKNKEKVIEQVCEEFNAKGAEYTDADLVNLIYKTSVYFQQTQFSWKTSIPEETQAIFNHISADNKEILERMRTLLESVEEIKITPIERRQAITDELEAFNARIQANCKYIQGVTPKSIPRNEVLQRAQSEALSKVTNFKRECLAQPQATSVGRSRTHGRDVTSKGKLRTGQTDP